MRGSYYFLLVVKEKKQNETNIIQTRFGKVIFPIRFSDLSSLLYLSYISSLSREIPVREKNPSVVCLSLGFSLSDVCGEEHVILI